MCYGKYVRLPSIQFVATAFFALGFALVSTGASGVLAVVLDDRPEWSVCGQEMCACAPAAFEAATPACPLCATGDKTDDPSACAKDTREEPVRRVPKSRDEADAADQAVQAFGSALYLSLVVGLPGPAMTTPDRGGAAAPARDRCPRSRTLGIPTPPPRA